MLDLVPPLIGIVVLLSFSAFFSGSETALMSLSRSQVKRFEHGTSGERTVFALLKDTQQVIATILVGNTFVNNLLTLLCAIITGKAAAQLIHVLPAGVDSKTEELTAIVLNIVIVPPMLMVFGELTPKSVAYRNSPVIAKLCAKPLNFIRKLLAPILKIFQIAVNATQLLMGIPRDEKWDMLTKAEVDATLSASVEVGTTSDAALELLRRILKLNDIQASEVMIPRTHVYGIEDSITVHEAFKQIKSCPFNFVPIYHENLDDIWGVALFVEYPIWINHEDKDKTLADFREDMEKGNSATPLPVYPIDFIPPTARIAAVLEAMKHKPKRFNVVVGEFGETLGVLTTTSILEEIVGRFSPKVIDNTALNRLANGAWTADGMTRLSLVKEELNDNDIDSDEADTLGGFIMEKLGKLPVKGDTFHLNDYKFIVVRMKGNRIEKVAIVKDQQAKEETRP